MKSTLLSTLMLSVLFACAAGSSYAAADPVTTAPDSRNYAGRVAYQVFYDDYLALRRTRPVDLLFIGDSITEEWRWGRGRPVWDKYYEKNAINFGQSGDRTQNVLWRLDNFDLSWAKPRAAIILIGTNNQDDTPEAIADGVKAVADKVRSKIPGIKVVVTSILPNERRTEKMAAANVLLAKLADQKSVFYFDLATYYPRDGDGNWQGLNKDKLHLNVDGYETWATQLNRLLQRVLE